jgi:hypothetical protein
LGAGPRRRPYLRTDPDALRRSLKTRGNVPTTPTAAATGWRRRRTRRRPQLLPTSLGGGHVGRGHRRWRRLGLAFCLSFFSSSSSSADDSRSLPGRMTRWLGDGSDWGSLERLSCCPSSVCNTVVHGRPPDRGNEGERGIFAGRVPLSFTSTGTSTFSFPLSKPGAVSTVTIHVPRKSFERVGFFAPTFGDELCMPIPLLLLRLLRLLSPGARPPSSPSLEVL